MGVSCGREFVRRVCWKPCGMAAFSTERARVLVPSLCRWGICRRGFAWLPLLAVLLVWDQLLEPPGVPFRVISGAGQDQHLYKGSDIGGAGFGSSWAQSQMERANMYAKELHIERC